MKQRVNTLRIPGCTSGTGGRLVGRLVSMLFAGNRSVWQLIGRGIVVVSVVSGCLAMPQEKPVPMDRKTLSEFVGSYQWAEDHFIYIRFWDELGKDQLGAFDESGMVRALFPLGHNRFSV